MRRLPIYFLIDVSESMVGEPIEEVQNGIRSIIQELRFDPYALETVYVSIIAFAGKARTLSELTELFKFYPPKFPIGGGTSLGVGLNHLMDSIDQDIQQTTQEIKGDWKPIVFLFTDGAPTDNPDRAIQRWNTKYRKGCNLIAISIGDNVDTKMLGSITDNVLRLKDTDANSFSAFFKWITASIKTSSVSVSETANYELKLSPIDGINLEKIDTNQPCHIDENFAVVIGKCQTTEHLYLIKYAKRIRPLGVKELEHFNVSDFKLVGAFPVEEESYKMLSDESQTKRNINAIELLGSPTCPCCGNQFGLVLCGCGNVFCAGDAELCKCPWCGSEGILEVGRAEEMNINRARG